MPIKFDFKKMLITRSQRVKCVDIHPKLPIVLVSLITGNLTMYDYSNQTTIKTIENSLSPIRSAKFIEKLQFIAVASDDLHIRIYNMNTLERVKEFQGHNDYIRSLIVHPQGQYLLSAADDGSIKLWDMSNDYKLVKTYTEHQQFVMQICLNPRDLNSFGSAAMDKFIKIWTINGTNNQANFTLKGHEAGVNCLDYYKGDKPYIASGSDDLTIKIWDYQTKQCLVTIEGEQAHSEFLSTVIFHPDLPILISAAEDGLVKLWNSQTYKLEQTIDYRLSRAWSIDICKTNSNIIAFGYDEGTVVIKMGKDEPIASLHNGKLIVAKNMDIFSYNLKSIPYNQDYNDGQPINVHFKDLDFHSSFYITSLRHAYNGFSFAISNDQEHSIHKTQTGKVVKASNDGDLVYGLNNQYASKQNNYCVNVHFDTHEIQYSLKTDFKIEFLQGGQLIGVVNQEFLIFYDWETGSVIRRLDVEKCQKIIWNEDNTLVAITTPTQFFTLSFNKQITQKFVEEVQDPEGCEDSFNNYFEINEQVQSGFWISDLFFFNYNNKKLNFCLQDQVFN